jgi:predicted regulator of Ras-like GTPase activity (Roadblock/LC7/MglB family)
MAILDHILEQMIDEVTGFVACAVVDLDGHSIASQSFNIIAHPESNHRQLTDLLKSVDASVGKMGKGIIEDNLTTTENAYILIRYLPGRQYYLSIAADRMTGDLGKLRLLSKIYAGRLSKAMKPESLF